MKNLKSYKQFINEQADIDVSAIILKRINKWHQLKLNGQIGIESVEKLKEHFTDFVLKVFSFINKDDTFIKLITANFITGFIGWKEFPNDVVDNTLLAGELAKIVESLFNIKSYIT